MAALRHKARAGHIFDADYIATVTVLNAAAANARVLNPGGTGVGLSLYGVSERVRVAKRYVARPRHSLPSFLLHPSFGRREADCE